MKWISQKKLPPRIDLPYSQGKGWRRETIVAWLKTHPEVISNG